MLTLRYAYATSLFRNRVTVLVGCSKGFSTRKARSGSIGTPFTSNVALRAYYVHIDTNITTIIFADIISPDLSREGDDNDYDDDGVCYKIVRYQVGWLQKCISYPQSTYICTSKLARLIEMLCS